MDHIRLVQALGIHTTDFTPVLLPRFWVGLGTE